MGERTVTYRRVPPPPITPLIGRVAELVELDGLVGRERVVTLTGAGGSGKTRLAHELARAVVERFPGGVAWVELASSGGGDAIVEATADVMDLPAGAGSGGMRAVVAALARRPANLLVLDNAEHVSVAVAELVAAIVAGAPLSSVLVTSREPIGVHGEIVWRTPSLTLPVMVGPAIDVATATGSEAVRLFAERARRARRGFAVTAGNVAAITQICVRLDGLPLAIELAAARVRSMPPERIAKELDDRFRLLTGGPRSFVERQQTLRASMAWSEGLLDDVERIVFRRLGVFHAGFTLDAASAVVASFGDVDGYDVTDVVGRLVDKSLVNLDDERDRYAMLETIRSYATERLLETGELAPARDAHAEWFAGWLEDEAQETELSGPNEWWDSRLGLIGRIDPEEPNCLAALEWTQPGSTVSLRLVAGLGDFWALRQRAADSRRVGMPAVTHGDRSDPWWLPAVVHLQAVRTNAGDADFEPIRAEAAERAGAIGDRAAELRLGVAGRIAEVMVFGPLRPVLDALEAIRTEARHEREWYSLWNASQSPAIVLTVTGRLAEASDLVTDLRSARADWIRTSIAIDRGDGIDGVAIASRVRLELLDRDGAALDRVLAVFAAAAAAFRLADRVPLSAIPLADPIDDLPAPFATAHLLGQGVDLLLAGRLDAALERFAARTPDLVTSWRLAGLRAQTEAAVGELDAASATATALADHARAIGAPGYHATAALVLSDVARAAGNPSEALALAHEALGVAAGSSLGLITIDAAESIAVLLHETGRRREAARLLAAADAARVTSTYHYRFAHRRVAIDSLITEARRNPGWDEGSGMALDGAVELARRMRGERSRPTVGWESLTPTELQVVELVAEGLTNPQVGVRLRMSRATVKTHLTHVYEKLGIRNRAELATAVTKRGRS